MPSQETRSEEEMKEMHEFVYGIINSFHPRTLGVDAWFYGFMLGKALQFCMLGFIVKFVFALFIQKDKK